MPTVTDFFRRPTPPEPPAPPPAGRIPALQALRGALAEATGTLCIAGGTFSAFRRWPLVAPVATAVRDAREIIAADDRATEAARRFSTARDYGGPGAYATPAQCETARQAILEPLAVLRAAMTAQQSAEREQAARQATGQRAPQPDPITDADQWLGSLSPDNCRELTALFRQEAKPGRTPSEVVHAVKVRIESLGVTFPPHTIKGDLQRSGRRSLDVNGVAARAYAARVLAEKESESHRS